MARDDTVSGDRPKSRASGRTAFVGRAQELEELRAGLQDAVARRGRLFLIVGEPGIGKTRLAEELGLMAAGLGARVVWGRCWDGGGAPVYWPWVQVVRALVRDGDLETVARQMGAGAPRIAQMVPEVRERLPDLPNLPSASDSADADARFPLFDATGTFLKSVAEAQPLVLLLDDLHAADHPSLLLLHFLARDVHDARLLLVGTYRDVEVQRHPERARVLHDVARNGHRIPLSGWSEAEVAHFIENALAQARGAAASPPLIAAVHHLTAGNPFFVDEVLRLLISESPRLPENVPAGGLRIPQGVSAAIRERLRPLSAACQGVLSTAAVIGTEFDVGCLQAAADVPTPELLELLSEAAVAGAIGPLRGTMARCDFGHVLIRDTLYHDIPPQRRMQLHRRVGEVMEQLYAMQSEAHLAELAHHFVAGGPECAEKALAYAERAARQAADVLAYEEAAARYEHALDILARRSPPDDLRQCELLLALGSVQSRAWNTPAAQETFRRVAARARHLQRTQPQPAAAILARAALGCGGAGVGVPRGVVDTELVALLEESVQALGDLHGTLRARVLARLAIELYFSDAAARRASLCEEAVSTARRLKDPATMAYTATARLLALWDSPDVATRLQWANEAIRLAEQAGDSDLTARGHAYRLAARIEMGAVHAWDGAIEVLARFAEELGQPRYASMAAALRAMRALWLGRYDEVETLGQQAMAIAERVQDRHAAVNVAVQMFVVRRAQGRCEELQPAVQAGVDRFPALPAARCMLALLHVDLGREADARTAFELLAADDFGRLRRSNALDSLLPWLTEICAALNDTRRAALLYERLQQFATRTISLVGRICFGPASQYLGVLAAMLARWDEAERHFEDALTRAAAMQGRPTLASTQYEYARMLLARGHGRDAERALDLAAAAQGIAHTLGMHGVLRKAAALEDGARFAVARRRQTDHNAGDRARAYGGGRAHEETRPDNSEEAAEPAAGAPRAPRSGRVISFPTSRSERKAGTSAGQRSERNGQPPAGGPQRPEDDGVFRLEGEYWTVSDGTTELRLRNTKGLQYIAQLLRHPGTELHVTDFVALEGPSGEPAPAAAALSAEQLRELGMRATRGESGAPLLDPQAKAAYKRRLEDLSDQLNEASSFNDVDRAARLRQEVDFLTHELARAVGLHGRDRPVGAHAERLRLNVTRAIKTAVQRIAARNPDLARYLRTTIRTGRFCSYTPDPRLPIRWRL